MSTRGRHGGRRGNSRANVDALPPSGGAAKPPRDVRSVLEAVSSNPALQGAHVIQRMLVQEGLEAVQPLSARQCASQALGEMLQGTGLSFSVLNGQPAGERRLPDGLSAL